MARQKNQSKRSVAAETVGGLARIDKRRGPIYLQVYRRIAGLIESGALASGARLPPSRSFALRLGVSRFTVSYAYDLLAADGYVAGHGRAGTLVRSPTTRASTHRAGGAAAAGDAGPSITAGPSTAAGATASPPPAPTTPLAVGVPPFELFPAGVWAHLVRRRPGAHGIADLGPGDPQGQAAFRRAVANRFEINRGLPCSPEQVFVTSGLAAATALIAEALVRPGDAVVVEEPGDPRCSHGLARAGARLLPVAVDADGLCVADLPARPAVRIAVVTPCCQFPTGGTLSGERRQWLERWARRHDTVIVEHDLQSEFRFAGATPPSLAGQYPDRVIHVLNLSESLFPAASTSCLAVPARLVPVFQAACRRLPPPPSPAVQAALTELIRKGHILRYVARALDVCAPRRGALAEAIRAVAPGASMHLPDAGLHLLVDTGHRLDHRTWAAFAARHLAPAPYQAFFSSPQPMAARTLVVGFASAPVARADELAQALMRGAAASGRPPWRATDTP